MSQPVFPVVGASGTIQTRLEIRDLAKDPYQWSLFIRAYINIQKPGYTYKGSTAPSWEQMGGIHGEPYKNWSGDPSASPDPINPGGDQWSGYCHHRSILFPTWHRVVVLLVEQAVCAEAAEIAQQLASACADPTEPPKWIAASQSLRFPFWDWTTSDTGVVGIPSVITDPTTSILDPVSGTISPDNPLQTYKLNGIQKDWYNSPNEEVPYYYGEWSQTYRWPNDVTPRSQTKDQLDKVKQGFSQGIDWHYLDDKGNVQTKHLQPYQWLMQQVYNMFTLPQKEFSPPKYHGNLWDIFAHSGLRDDKNDFEPPQFQQYLGMSIETPHDMVHLLVGGYGHMADNNFAAFDPIFFLHHCNVDRLYAFWAFVYPDAWMDKGYTAIVNDEEVEGYKFGDVEGTFDLKDGSDVDNLTHLTPFRTAASGNPYWISDDVKTVQSLNYTYPTLAGVNINKNLTPFERAICHLSLQRYFHSLLDHVNVLEQPPPSTPSFLLHPNLDQNLPPTQRYRHFTVLVIANEWSYDLSHSIELYLPERMQTSHWGAEPPAPVGGVYILKRGNPGRCANCVGRNASREYIGGQIVLDHVLILGLLQRNQLDNEGTTEEQIVNMLTTSFRARVVDGNWRVLADGRLGDEPSPNHGTEIPTGDSRIPKMTLFSASKESLSDTNSPGPIYYDNWQNHGELSHSWTQY